tara:strand:+ start:1524 stop:1952 length:429 start_codon:yes stop_codon:yes gene_type:complete
MNTILLFLIGIPALEIFVMIKIGENIGAFNTVSLIFLTAIIGIYFAKMQGLNTLRSGVYSLYKNEIPLFEIISGASIALAACLLILPGFVTDTIGFLLLLPWTRKIIVKSLIKKQNTVKTKSENYIEGEIVEKKNNKKEDDI